MGRRALEKHASRLGIAFTSEVSDEDLQRAITNREESLMSDSTETLADIEFTEEPEKCYGVNWDALTDETCKACAVKFACLERYVTGELPQVIARIGSSKPADVARESWTSEKSAALALEKMKSGTVQLVADEDADQKFWDEQYEKRKAAEAAHSPDPQPETPKEAPVPATKKADAKKAPAKKAKKAASKKAPAKKKTTTKKKVAKKKAKRASNPKKTGSAQSASAPVFKVTIPPPVVERAKEQAAETRSWGDMETRWQRERDRSPAIAAVTPGCKLKKLYKGETYTVRCNKGSWTWNQKKYPTLYAVTKEITGIYERDRQRKRAGSERSRPEGTRKLSNWSATKFWATALRDALQATGGTLPPKKPTRKASKKTPAKKKPVKKSKKATTSKKKTPAKKKRPAPKKTPAKKAAKPPVKRAVKKSAPKKKKAPSKKKAIKKKAVKKPSPPKKSPPKKRIKKKAPAKPQTSSTPSPTK